MPLSMTIAAPSLIDDILQLLTQILHKNVLLWSFSQWYTTPSIANLRRQLKIVFAYDFFFHARHFFLTHKHKHKKTEKMQT